MQTETVLLTEIALTIAFCIEFLIAYDLIKKDSSYRANQFLSLAYVCLGLTIFFNLLYFVFVFPINVVLILHRLTNVFAILFGVFIFATVSYIRFGSQGLKKADFIVINLISLILIIGVFLYDGVTITFDQNLVLTTWSFEFLLICSIPIFLLGSITVFYYYRLYQDLKSDKNIASKLKMSMLAYATISVAYFISRTPFYLVTIYPDLQNAVQLIGLLASGFVVIFSIIVAWIFLQRKITID